MAIDSAIPETRSELQHGSQDPESCPFIVPRNPAPDILTSVSPLVANADRGDRLGKPPQEPTQRRKRGISWPSEVLNHAWLIEFLSLVLASLAFAAIVITLSIHENRPIPQWPHLISINSLLAVFTAIMKAALVFPVAESLGQLKWRWFRKTRTLIDLDQLDSATRGPWGSSLILLKAFRSPFICLGAFITVVALAIDPFSQQVVQYHDCLEPLKAVGATIATATNYTRYGVATSAKDRTLDAQMASSVYTGLIDPPSNASSSISFDCPTGNCTFVEVDGITHQSLAMCGICEDLSSTVIQNHTEATGGPVFPDDEAAIYHILPSTFDIWSSKNATIKTAVGDDWTVVQTWLSTNSYSSSYGSWYISAFDALMYRNCSCEGGAVYGQGKCDCDILGANCAIYPCVKTYKARVHNFVLEETEVSRIALVNSSKSNDAFGYGYNMEKVVRGGEMHVCGARPEAGDGFPVEVYLNSTFNSATNTSTAEYEYYPEGCLFQFGWGTTWALRMYLKGNMLGGTLERSITNRPYGADGSPWLSAMFNNGSATLDTLQTYIDGLTNAMTAVIRKYGDSPTTTQVKGTAYVSRTCVRVRWPWLSLPAALLVLAALFLGMTMWTTSQGQEIAWKSSPLPLLFHGFDPEVVDKYHAAVLPGEMQEAARSIYAKLEKQQTGWHLAVS